MELVTVYLDDGSRVIGKLIDKDQNELKVISVVHDHIEGTLIHIGSDLPGIASSVLKIFKEVGIFEGTDTDLLDNLLLEIEKGKEFNSKVT